ncbi:MAG: Gfo/Idh/MocA family oxidoreductase [Phycisphaerales bacterium]|nr:Gfo/Idh/MocA family oxidoreductase [Phycisphaerales bacterium]
MSPTSEQLKDIAQSWPMPSRPRPIIIIGAGGIVRAAHLPAYRAAGLPVIGVFDVDSARATELARDFGVPRAFATLDEALATDESVVFDLALPPLALPDILPRIPTGRAVLVQKPFGIDLAAATALRDICRERKFIAAVNFQLRFAPNMLVMRDLLARRLLGRIVDIEVRVCVNTPWRNWRFLRGLPRMEIALHSIHYLDLLRSVFGEPVDVVARTFGDAETPDLHSTRTSAILTFSDKARGVVTTHHAHRFGRRFQASDLRVEGTNGALIAKMGVNLNYPSGEPDELAVAFDRQWNDIPLCGSWFPEGFAGPMQNLQRFACGEDAVLHTGVEDAWRTMELVETCYRSSGL